jgi:hypothetical protein
MASALRTLVEVERGGGRAGRVKDGRNIDDVRLGPEFRMRRKRRGKVEDAGALRNI